MPYSFLTNETSQHLIGGMIRKTEKVNPKDETTKLPREDSKIGEAGQLDDSDVSNLYEEDKKRVVTDISEDMLLKENKQTEKDS